jgi:creatinine amidohydrolase
MKKGIDLTITAWKEVKDTNYDVAVLPWGATEPHNLHLPYGTDSILSYEIACMSVEKALLKGIRCIVLPAVPFGSQNPGQTDLMFCIHTRYDTQRAILTDIVASLNHQGLRKLVIVNGHGGNNFRNMIRDLAIDYPDFYIAVSDWYTVEKGASYFDVPGDHADELETSVMMHFHPEWVLPLENAGNGDSKTFSIPALLNKQAWMPRHWTKVTSDTGIGNPKAATAEKGKRFADSVTDSLAQFLVDFTNTGADNLYK